jgi:hypothetical protein
MHEMRSGMPREGACIKTDKRKKEILYKERGNQSGV